MTVITGINGFGRFSLHLLKYWLDRQHEAKFRIAYINDDTLSQGQSYEIINTDPYVRFDDYRIDVSEDNLIFRNRDGAVQTIAYTNEPQPDIPWHGKPDVIFECSGKYTKTAACQNYLTGQARLVMISATSWDPDKTLIYGFNQDSFNPAQHKVISYGSCTVNAYVPLANYLHETFGVVDSEVNVVHNIVRHRLAQHKTLLRKFCTLEKSAPQLLPFVDDTKNFVVNYTVVPYDGVSMIDFRFRLAEPVTREAFLEKFEAAMNDGPLAGLYAIEQADVGPEAHNCTPYSAVFIRDGVKIRGDNVYLQSYFDTENSVNRFFDLANCITPQVVG